jgi:hypothetical protein
MTWRPIAEDQRVLEAPMAPDVASISSVVEWQVSQPGTSWRQNLAEHVARSTPANAVLLDWARSGRNQPPQSWWDDETDPFARADE